MWQGMNQLYVGSLEGLICFFFAVADVDKLNASAGAQFL
jgi:hypothetical protein